MSCKKIILPLLILLVGTITLGMATATDTNNTTSTDDVLPAPIQINKTIEYTNNTQTPIAYNQPITQNQPTYEIHDQKELQQALQWGGHYKLNNNIKINDDITKNTDKQVTIDGQHHTISGYKDGISETVIYIYGPTTFKNTEFTDLRVACHKDATFEDCIWMQIEAADFTSSAAFYARECLVTLTNCQFQHCYSRHADHGAFYAKDAWVHMNNCTFENCWNIHAMGSNNEGGAIFTTNTDLFLTGCHFKGCECLGDGGAVAVEGGHAKIDNCDFKNCRNQPKIWIFSTSNKGAGIYCMGDAEITNCTFTNCHSDGMRYEAWNGNIDRENDVTVTVKDCIFN